jgi:hypothetical protein
VVQTKGKEDRPMSEHDRDLAQMEHEQGVRHREAQALIQEAIAEVSALGRDLPVADIKELLARALEARGIGPQPKNWLASVADELSSGGTYVEDPASEEARVVATEPDSDPV